MSVTQSLVSRIALMALAALVTQTANAATTQKSKATQSSSSSADGIEPAALTEAGAASPSQSATSAIETNTVSPTNTSTAGLAKEIQAAAPRRWFGEFYTETNEDMKDVRAGTGTPQLASYGGIKYDFGNARALSVRQNFVYNSAGDRGVGDFHIDDTVINYTDGKLATFWKDGTILLIGRTYLPTGETSRFVTHQAGKERLYLFETKSFGKWDLTLVQLGQDFHYTQDTWRNSKGEEKQSNFLAGTAEFDAFYNFTSKFSLGFIAGADALLNRPLAGKDARSDDFYIQPTAQLIPVKGVTAQLYLYNEVDTRAPTHSFALLRDDDNALQVWANLAVSL